MNWQRVSRLIVCCALLPWLSNGQSDLSKSAGACVAGSSSGPTAPPTTACLAPNRPLRIVPFVDRNSAGKDPLQGSPPVVPNATNPGPAGAHLTYYGGPVVSNVQVVIVFWGPNVSPVVTTGIYNFYNTVVDSTYLDLLYENSTFGLAGVTTNQKIGHGTVLSPITITPSSSASSITDTFIQTEIRNQIAAGHLPPPSLDSQGNSNTLYALYFPPGVTISEGGIGSCRSGGFCAYHGTAYSSQSQVFQYSVLPDFGAGGCSSGCGNSSEFNNLTSVSSHELAETITDAQVSFATTNAPPLAWYDNTYGENGDICNAIQGKVTAHGSTYTVQELWSNQQGVCTDGPQAFFTVSTSPVNTVVGTPVAVTVTVKNKGGQTLPFYTGSISFSSTDSGAQLPSSYTFCSADAGTQTFNSVIFSKAGTLAITVQDVDNPSITGSASETVAGGKTTPSISWATPASITYGTALSATQLNATSTVPGTFFYVPAAGAILSPGPQTLRVTFTPTDTTNFTTALASVTLQVNQPATATFQTLDTGTLGNWPGIYGQDGYIIANSPSSPPSYATVSFSGSNTWTWVASTSQPSALLKSPSTTDRIASTYYSGSFTIDLTLTGGMHQVALYLLDLDTTSRAETISILDPGSGNAVLDSRQFSSFNTGQYAIWNLQGHLLIQVTRTAGLNAVVSGLFFRTLGSSNPPSVSITSPAPGVVTGAVTITANAQSTAGIQSVQFLLDGANFGSPVTSGRGGNYSISWATAGTANGPHTLKAIALDTLAQSTLSAGVAVTVSNSSPPPSGSAVFLRTDTTTQGNWKSSYGADGALIANDSSHVPSYATVALGNALQWTWAAPTADVRALTRYSPATGRIASAYYNTPSFTYDVNFADGQSHQVALYLLDWDGGRVETVSILDAAGTSVLDTHILSGFGGGQYLVWNVQGHVLVKVQIVSGVSAAASALFLGAASAVAAPPNVSITSPAPNASLSNIATLSASASSSVGIASVQFVLDNTTNLGAPVTAGPYTYQWNTALGVINGPHTLTAIATDTLSQQTTSAPVAVTVNNTAPATSGVFVTKDSTTSGNWKTHYGGDGQIVANDSNNLPTYAALNFAGASSWTWAANTGDPRAAQQAAGSGRIASTFYASNNFSIDVNFKDAGTHQLALYFLDWDDGGRAQTITLLDATTQTVLSTQTITGFRNGAYLVWNIKGHVTVQFNRLAGQNAVVSGVFLAAGG